MNKLSKEQERRVSDLRARWLTAKAELRAQEELANEEISVMEAALGERIDGLNALVEEANALREEIASAAQESHDAKSEKWQESDRGSNFSDWISSWNEEVEEVEPILLDRIERAIDLPEDLLSEDEYPSEPRS